MGGGRGYSGFVLSGFQFFGISSFFLLRAGGPEFETRWAARYSGPIKTSPKPTQPPKGYWVPFPGVKCRGVAQTTQPILAPKLTMGRDIPVPPLSA